MFAARSAAQLDGGVLGHNTRHQTLLHVAARSDDALTVGLALARGAPPAARDITGTTALRLAAGAGAVRAMRVLLRCKEVRDNAAARAADGMGAVHAAALAGEKAAVRLLVEVLGWGRLVVESELPSAMGCSPGSRVMGFLLVEGCSRDMVRLVEDLM